MLACVLKYKEQILQVVCSMGLLCAMMLMKRKCDGWQQKKRECLIDLPVVNPANAQHWPLVTTSFRSAPGHLSRRAAAPALRRTGLEMMQKNKTPFLHQSLVPHCQCTIYQIRLPALSVRGSTIRGPQLTRDLIQSSPSWPLKGMVLMADVLYPGTAMCLVSCKIQWNLWEARKVCRKREHMAV